jgi:uncharacterized membrane protein YfcA
MNISDITLLAGLFFVVAIIFSAIGHAGASGYLAVMALMGLAPEVMKPTALTLNILVATVATIQFSRSGFFSWRALWPFVLTSIPMAFVGGAYQLPGALYKAIVATILVLSALMILASQRLRAEKSTLFPQIPIAWGFLSGAAIGLVSGLVGTGGGVFLSPLLVLMCWATVRQATGVIAAFVLLNSIAGLAGFVSKLEQLPTHIYLWLAAVLLGALIGTELGRKKLQLPALESLLTLVLLIAGLKMALL